MIKFFRKIRQNLLMENKTSKYFKYAIGEIILVVIGILIALQINNWNDLAIQKKQKRTYIESLIGNLEQDSISLDRFLVKSKNEYDKTMNHITRIYSPMVTADSLINIARYEFNQSTYVFASTFHNETFKTLVASGEIELFDSEVSNGLMQLNSLQEQAILNIETHNENYIRQLTKYGEKYPMLPAVPKIESPVQKMLWESINKKEFSSLFMSVVALKAVLVANGKNYNEEIKNKTSLLLRKLRKQKAQYRD